MKFFASVLLLFAALILPSTAHATAIGGARFTKAIYLESSNLSPTPSALNDGRDYASAKPLVDGNLWAIPKNCIVDNVFVIVDEAISGLTAFNVGDTDTSNGYIASTSPFGSLGATGLKYWDVDYKGSYLKGGSVVANHELSKFYSATGKYLTLDITGTSTAGRARVFATGYCLEAPGL